MGKVDYPDLVWLQILRVKDGDLYGFVERYLAEYAAFAEGAVVDDAHRTKLASELKKFATDGGPMDPRSIWRLTHFIPGIRPGKEESAAPLFNKETQKKITAFEAGRRLGSPQHSRYYFAFAHPAGAIEDSELVEFISLASRGKDLEEICMTYIIRRGRKAVRNSNCWWID